MMYYCPELTNSLVLAKWYSMITYHCLGGSIVASVLGVCIVIIITKHHI